MSLGLKSPSYSYLYDAYRRHEVQKMSSKFEMRILLEEDIYSCIINAK